MKKPAKPLSAERAYDVVRRPIITEKTTLMGEHGQVAFEVARNATKPEIKQAVETLFKVQVRAVNTIVQKGKTKRFRGVMGKRPDIKKAIVTLAEGQAIDVSTGI